MTERKANWTKPIVHSRARIIARGGRALDRRYVTDARGGIRRKAEVER